MGSTHLQWNGFRVRVQKKPLVVLSTDEDDYEALEPTMSMIETTKNFIVQNGIMPDGIKTIKTEKHATWDMISKSHVTKRRKIIYLRHHYIKDVLKPPKLNVLHVTVAEQNADMFTNKLHRVQFYHQCRTIGVVKNTPYGECDCMGHHFL